MQKEAAAVPERTGRFYLPELDVLRFFAVFGVFIYHAVPGSVTTYQGQMWPNSLLNAGAFGVGLFFTLSGYLITGLLLRERKATGDINLRAFYARRTLRIWPLYYFSLAFAFLISHLPASMTSAPMIGDVFPPMQLKTYFFMAIFLSNFNFYDSLMMLPLPFMAHLWSISVEEQFYLFWPWFARYFPRKRIIIIPIVMIAIGCVVRATLTFNLQRLVWNYTFVHFDSIAVGILIAILPALNPGRALRLLLLAVGIASWVFAASYCGLPYEHDTLKISMGYPAIAFGSGAFLLATIGAESLRTKLAPVRLMVYLGKISYGIYVYDIFAISTAKLFMFRGILNVILPKAGQPETVKALYVLLAFVLNVALAAASYRWLEAPFLRLKQRFERIPSRAV